MSTSERRTGAYSRLVLSGRARHVSFGDDTLVVDLEDGRQIAVPIAWFPRLAAAGAAERSNWELVGRGIGIHWPDIDEDISVENLLGADGELLIASDLGLGMEKLAIDMVENWRGRPDDPNAGLAEKLCAAGFFFTQEAAERFIPRARRILARRKAEAEAGIGDEPTGPLPPNPVGHPTSPLT